MSKLAPENIKWVEAYVGWSRGVGTVSNLIMRLDDSYFSHVYRKFVSKEGIVVLYESHLSGGVQITPYEHLLSAKLHKKVTATYEKRIPIDASNVQLLWNDCLPLHGDAYDLRQIFVYWAWIRLFHKRKSLRFKTHRNDRYTCNEFYVKSGISQDPFCIGMDYSYTPERLFRRIEGKKSNDMFNIKLM